MDNGEWEEIDSNTITSSDLNSDEFVVINDDSNLSDPLIFPPSDHSLTREEEDNNDNNIDGDGSFQEPSIPHPPRWRACIKMVGFGIVEVACKIRFYGGVWPIAAAGLLGLVVWYGKGKPWRPPKKTEVNWMILSREKDQKIRQLLLQIAQMNESLSASQTVPVHRVS